MKIEPETFFNAIGPELPEEVVSNLKPPSSKKLIKSKVQKSLSISKFKASKKAELFVMPVLKSSRSSNDSMTRYSGGASKSSLVVPKLKLNKVKKLDDEKKVKQLNDIKAAMLEKLMPMQLK